MIKLIQIQIKIKKRLGQFLAGISTVLFCQVFLHPALFAQGSAPPIQTLIVTGQNYHNWQATSAALKRILEDSGLFQVKIVVTPPSGSKMDSFRPDFSSFKLVVLDYSGDPWPKATQKAFADFVKNGGGVVIYHSANNAFPAWPEYNEIIGLAGWLFGRLRPARGMIAGRSTASLFPSRTILPPKG